jgi:hypothetical protein
MLKRNYTRIQVLLPEIKKMIESGKSHREIELYFGLQGDRPIHNLMKRERRNEKKRAAGIVPLPKGRPRVLSKPIDIVTEQAYEIKRLKMENELLRDFLHLAGRK